MKYSQSALTKPYAKAYLNMFETELSSADIDHIKTAVYFFRRHHDFMFLVNVLVSDSDENHNIVQELFEHFSLPESLRSLFRVLKNHQALILFAQVLQDICCLYALRNNILEMTMMSACALSDEEQKTFEAFFVKHSGKKIVTFVRVDPTLIAGVRMQSDFYLWDYSVASRLKKIRQSMLIKE